MESAESTREAQLSKQCENRWWGGKLSARVIVKQRLESGEEVNAANTWGKYTLCKGSRSGQSGRQDWAGVATSWQRGRAQGPRGGSRGKREQTPDI